MLDSRRLRIALAADAAATVAAGLAVYLRPALLTDRVSDDSLLAPFVDGSVARRVGLGVATFGAVKGLAYAALARYGDGRAGDGE